MARPAPGPVASHSPVEQPRRRLPQPGTLPAPRRVRALCLQPPPPAPPGREAEEPPAARGPARPGPIRARRCCYARPYSARRPRAPLRAPAAAGGRYGQSAARPRCVRSAGARLGGRAAGPGAGGRRAGGGSACARSGCGTACEKFTPRSFVREPAGGSGRKEGTAGKPARRAAVGAAAAALHRPQREGGVWSGEAGRLVPGLPAAEVGLPAVAAASLLGGPSHPPPGAPRPGWVPALLCPATEVASFFLSSSRRKLAVFSFLLETMHESVIGSLPLHRCLGANEADADVSALGAAGNVYFKLAAYWLLNSRLWRKAIK